MSFFSYRLKAAAKAAFFHLIISLFIIGCLAVLVFGFWFPFPYDDLVGGRKLFVLISVVDVVCGSLMTLILFNPKKKLKELIFDLGFIVVIQVCALGYGLYSVFLARPVFLVFQVNDFRAVTAAEIVVSELKIAPISLQKLPLFGPRILGTRNPKNSVERMNAMELSFQGYEISTRPSWWQDYALNHEQVLRVAKEISELKIRRPSQVVAIDDALKKINIPEADIVWIPLVSRKSMDWVVFVDRKTVDVRGFAHVDGYEIEKIN